MKVEQGEKDTFWLYFDNTEMTFLQNEAKDNDMSIIAMFEMLLGMLFIGGYSNVVGKDKANDVERKDERLRGR